MLRQLTFLSVMSVACVAMAGDHFSYHYPSVVVHRPMVVGPAVHSGFWVPEVPVIQAYPVMQPVLHPAPVIVHQPAYVVPTYSTMGHHASLSPMTVHTQHYYAPTISSYYFPRAGYSRHYRPRDIEIEYKFRRNGTYRIDVDYD